MGEGYIERDIEREEGDGEGVIRTSQTCSAQTRPLPRSPRLMRHPARTAQRRWKLFLQQARRQPMVAPRCLQCTQVFF